jgi:hypothetical protein
LFDFPSSPVEDQVYTPAGGPTYVYKSPAWRTSNGFADAPSDGKDYVRRSGLWTSGGYRVIADINLASPAATADFVIPADITQMRISGVFNATVSNAQLGMRFSADNGSTYDAGAAAYATSYISQALATVSGGSLTASYMTLSAGVDNSQYFRIPVTASFVLGSVGSFLTRGISQSAGWSQAQAVVTNSIWSNTWQSSTARPTNARFHHPPSGNLGAGTRFIIEGV